MNAQELYELVKDWPREAWPEGVVVNPQPDDYPFMGVSDHMGIEPKPGDFFQIPAAHATLMFEASGMRWLDASGSFVAKLASGTYSVVVRTDLSVRITSSSKLHAIDAAIKEINK